MEPVRISKLLAERGLCSRREADSYIERGWVLVDGQVVTELGTKAYPHQEVTLKRQAQSAQTARVTILLNKPVGYVSGQAEDGHRPAAALVTPHAQWDGDRSPVRFAPSHLYGLAPAGRLDIDSQGLLVLTQDGRIARALVGEDSTVEKEYLVRVQGHLSEGGLALLNHGLSLDGVQLRPAKVSWQNEDQLRFILQEGRKRQIRRMCDMVGLKVVGLKRVRIGNIRLGDLPPGQWRYLGRHESLETPLPGAARKAATPARKVARATTSDEWEAPRNWDAASEPSERKAQTKRPAEPRRATARPAASAADERRAPSRLTAELAQSRRAPAKTSGYAQEPRRTPTKAAGPARQAPSRAAEPAARRGKPGGPAAPARSGGPAKRPSTRTARKSGPR